VKLALAVSVALFVLLAPFAQVQLTALPMFVPLNQTVLIVNDLVTATLLIFQLRATRSRALLVLACGYVFTALMALAHLLTFPGALAAAGLLGGGPQTTGYLFVFWHTGFPLAVIGYALTKRRPPVPDGTELPVAQAMATALLAAAALCMLAVAGSDMFPPMLEGNKYASSFNVGRYGQWLITAMAAWVVWRSKPLSVLDHWLLVMLCAWFIEIALVGIFNAGRYDLGFYAGRVYGLLASTFVLSVLLWEQSRLYSNLGEALKIARSEADLRENRAVLRLALEGGRMGAWSADLRSDKLWWSAELEQIVGLPAGTFSATRKACFELIHPHDLPAVRQVIEAGVAQRQDLGVEFRVRHRTGEWRWMDARGRANFDAVGRPATLFGIGIDITARKRSEDAARQIEARFRTLADGIPQLAWMARPDGWIYWYNQRWYDYTGSTPQAMQGWGWQSVHDPRVLPEVLSRWQASIATGEQFEMVFPLKAANGDFRSFLTRVSPFKDADGNVMHWFGTNTDITAQRDAEAALRDADRRKDEFLATLAHELRNPLAPIRNAVEMMARAAPLPGNLERIRGVIDRQSRHMARLIDDLMDVSRITQGKVTLRTAPVSLREALLDAIEATRAAAQAQGHEVLASLPDDPMVATADWTRVTQVFVNLLNNAIKFTPAGGRIFIGAERSGPQAVISIRDTGIGIDAQHISGIFDIFSQVIPALERSQGGLGIGLALVRGFVQLHGGTVECRSGGAGKGTEFILRLPLLAVASPPASGAAPTRPPAGNSTPGLPAQE
jgi:PAS domain S-box-containing protein